MKEEKKTAFCINCDEYRSYHIKARKNRRTLIKDNLSFVYIERHAYCDECGEEVYVAEINDSNVESMYEAYHAVKKRREGND